ncbi:hypothetical protein BHE74_00014414 [Ensete ventricosum]|uniref:Uncharacterized protein n=1 Tax=Ensete ventricosum TaxID=4639 RepID=A0A444E6A1_ENSVE|nr:hypothetical protein GW17_00030808 [Ensete ventricosum]RWW77434.1 hypothetical protein BHE74_00014414 [Ensete ventricosum]RZR70734.1 hypothetical protein BHM03_00001211 [Ensete ventricosum]
MDLFGSVSASDPIYSLALVPVTTNSGSEADLPANSSFATDFVAATSASAVFSQAGENPFGDPPFKATQENFPNQQENFQSVSSFNSISSGGAEILAPAAPKIETTTSFGFDGSFGGVTYNPVSDSQQSSFPSPAILTSEAPATQPNNITAKINPHADIGIDFDSINRKEKRKEEKKVSAAPISTTTMGKAMGSGSGIGRAGANILTRPLNPTMGMGMGMGMGIMGGGGMGMGMMGNGGMGMGGYGGSINQPMGMGMPPRPSMGAPMGGSGMPGVGYNPMMGMGNYGSQQPYGGGYR